MALLLRCACMQELCTGGTLHDAIRHGCFTADGAQGGMGLDGGAVAAQGKVQRLLAELERVLQVSGDRL